MVESSGLLNRRRVKNSTGGSNPPLSASLFVYFDQKTASLSSRSCLSLEALAFFCPAIYIENSGHPVYHRFQYTERAMGTHTMAGYGPERHAPWR